MNTKYELSNIQNISLDKIYTECSGPGGLKLVDFLADKMGIEAGKKLLDAGANRGFPTCYLTKKYNTFTVAIDPWDDRTSQRPQVDYITENAHEWNVADKLIAIKLALPETFFADGAFDYAYSTTTLEMIRTLEGEEGYRNAVKEIFRVLKPGGIFGLGEPMHLETEMPEDLIPYLSQEPFAWKDCFKSLSHTLEAIYAAGFEVIEAGYAPDATLWWQEYAEHDPYCKLNPEEDPKTLAVDNGRWTSFGYIVARKPLNTEK